MLKLSVLFLFFLNTVFALDVLITTEPIRYQQVLDPKKVTLKKISKLKKACVPLTVKDLKDNKYITRHYINRYSILCKKDVELSKSTGVIFNFGNLEIHQNGKIMYQNDKIIKIKKPNGKAEIFYKDGRINE